MQASERERQSKFSFSGRKQGSMAVIDANLDTDVMAMPVIRREIGNVAMERDNDLRCTHYSIRENSGHGIPVEIYISDELRTGTMLPFRRLKEFAITELIRITNDPFGETSIDPHSMKDEARDWRAVNRLRDDIRASVGQPIAIKSSIIGSEKYEPLIDQYLFMRELQLAAEEKLTERQKEVLEFLPVYGAIKVGEQEFLIMKHIEEASEMREHTVRYRSHGWPGSGDPDFETAFLVADHGDLLEAFDLDSYGSDYMRWRDVRGELGLILGITLHDIESRNVLFYQRGGHNKYVVIDQRRHGIQKVGENAEESKQKSADPNAEFTLEDLSEFEEFVDGAKTNRVPVGPIEDLYS